MSRTSLWVSLGLGMLMTGSGCGGSFASVGTDAGGASQGGTNTSGGASSGQGGTATTGGSTSCGAIPLVMPLCLASGSAALQYDASGCPTHYACTCTAGGVTYVEGDTFRDSDGCNACKCGSQGGVECTMMLCVAQGGSSSGAGGATSVGGGISVAGTTGAGGCSNAIPMVMPVCTDGTAVMQYDASGCPISYGCPDTMCKCTGPTLGAPNYVCADGTTGGPVCAVKADGSCSWILRSCPTTA